MAKIGIFGGTFDPIHIGHLRVAQEFATAFGLDQVLMMVAGIPPHREPPTASPEDRLRMVQLAVGNCPSLTASDIELHREGPSFTLDTVKEVSKAAENSLVWMALGGDAYSLINSWYRSEDVLAQVHLVVLTRPGYPVDLMTPLPKNLSERYTPAGGVYLHDSGGSLRTLQVSPVDVSSSMIRKAVSGGHSIRNLVTDEVLQYIQQKGLYRPQKV
ncbi:MAG: nicotinate-nucleotide adenylyltransferase [bacterium]|nr:nicotinate-nucleotide adenylyltransferase [bacterium]MDT8365701.1 nicotinate-nucleotide adenylyltransferase [bacterium]